jgi:hypothetical protein
VEEESEASKKVLRAQRVLTFAFPMARGVL